MLIVENIFSSPEENVAVDELLLMKAERGEAGESLRFWESAEYFVVLGRAGKVLEECLYERCLADGIKIVRRMSGGGTILQGPGSLNYSLVLSYERYGCMRDVVSSYHEILRGIVASLKNNGFPDAGFFPISDIALGDKKISGNAQARKKNFFLHHGTVLFNMDLAKISEYLKYPPNEPEYRKGRPHSDFIANIPATREQLEKVIGEAFRCSGAKERIEEKDIEELRDLVRRKYSSDSWNLCF